MAKQAIASRTRYFIKQSSAVAKNASFDRNKDRFTSVSK